MFAIVWLTPRCNFVTQVQYRYLYEAVEEYIRGEAIYANTCM